MLLAQRCAVCDRSGPSPCATCHRGLRPPAPDVDPPGLDGLVALLRYDGPARALVARVKYRNRRQALAWLASGLAAHVAGAVEHPFDVVTWAPTTDGHVRARGFDHAEALARGVGRTLGVRARPLLRRCGEEVQTGRAAHERRADGPTFSPRTRLAPGTRVLLVDDVVTTGTTLRAARRALLDAGATVVVPAAVARTPGRGAPP